MSFRRYAGLEGRLEGSPTPLPGPAADNDPISVQPHTPANQGWNVQSASLVAATSSAEHMRMNPAHTPQPKKPDQNTPGLVAGLNPFY